MKCMVTWSTRTENFKEVFARFKAGASTKAPAGVKMLGRWHEPGTGKGFMAVEVEDMTAFTGWVMGWSDLLNQTVVPVVEDEDILKNL
jgi:hypothetical protein